MTHFGGWWKPIVQCTNRSANLEIKAPPQLQELSGRSHLHAQKTFSQIFHGRSLGNKTVSETGNGQLAVISTP